MGGQCKKLFEMSLKEIFLKAISNVKGQILREQRWMMELHGWMSNKGKRSRF